MVPLPLSMTIGTLWRVASAIAGMRGGSRRSRVRGASIWRPHGLGLATQGIRVDAERNRSWVDLMVGGRVRFVGASGVVDLFASGVVNKKLGPMMDYACCSSIHFPRLLDIPSILFNLEISKNDVDNDFI